MDSWFESNLKSAITLLLPVGVIFVLSFSLPKILKTVHSQSFDSETYGLIDTIITYKGIHESLQGGRIVTVAYQIKYHYNVKEEKYLGVAYLHHKTVPTKLWLSLKNFKSGDTVGINYKVEMPSQSILIVGEFPSIPSLKNR